MCFKLELNSFFGIAQTDSAHVFKGILGLGDVLHAQGPNLSMSSYRQPQSPTFQNFLPRFYVTHQYETSQSAAFQFAANHATEHSVNMHLKIIQYPLKDETR